MKYLRYLSLIAIAAATTAHGQLLTNADFTTGADGKTGWVTYLNVFDTATTNYKYGTPYDTLTATPGGSGSVTLTSHPGWTDNGNGPLDLGDTIENNFYADFGGTPSFAGQTVTFSGNISVATPFDGSNYGVAFIKILDAGWQISEFVTADASSGTFSLQATVPTTNMNSFQVGFLTYSVAGTNGALTASNLNLAVVPEPGTYALFLGLFSLGFIAYRRRK